jgi:thioesterase domain-containing protein
VPVVVLIDTRAPDPAGRRIRRRIAARVVAVQTGGLPQPAKSLAYVRAVVRPRRWWWGMTAGHVARTGPAQWNCFTVLREYALDRYRPGRYGGDVVLLRAADQSDGHKATGDLSGWLRLLDRPARIVEIEGRHSTVVRPPYLQGTAERVRAALQSHDAERPTDPELPPDPPEPTDRMSAS